MTFLETMRNRVKRASLAAERGDARFAWDAARHYGCSG